MFCPGEKLGSINFFAIVFQSYLEKRRSNGHTFCPITRDFAFYDERFRRLAIPFGSLNQAKEDRFPYASSQYNKMSEEVVDQCFSDIRNMGKADEIN